MAISTNKPKGNRPIAVMGLPINGLTPTQAVEAIDELIQAGGSNQIATANLDFWMKSLTDTHLHRIIAGCSLVFADGMPLVWAAAMMRSPIPGRVTGVDLVPALAELSARKGYRIYLLGGRPGAAERTAQILSERFPGANFVECYAPTMNDMALNDHTEILSRIQAAKPHILLVGLGNPKQEKWIWMHRKRLNVPVAMGVGGAFDMIAGQLKRAPGLAQRIGMEWFVRLLQEPSRLGPRYFHDFVALVRRFPQAFVAAWTQKPHLGASFVDAIMTPQGMQVYIRGKLSAGVYQQLHDAVEECVTQNNVMVLHMEGVKQITPDGMGLLLDVRRSLLEAGLTLSLSGLNLHHRFIVHSWCVRNLFDEWQASLAFTRAVSPPTVTSASNDAGGEGESLRVQTRARL